MNASVSACPSRRAEIRTAHHRLWLFSETGAFWEHLHEAIGGARRSVWLSTYIYRNDRLGRRFGEHLARAAERGTDVRVLYDSQGSRGQHDDDYDWLRKRGVRVQSYRAWRPIRERWKYFPRDHGRLLIVDDAAFTGGVNWGDEWLPAAEGGGGWHDVAIGVVGPRVDDFRHAFELRWAEADATHEAADHLSQAPDSDVQFVADSPSERSIVFDKVCAAVEGARKRVWMENAYCVPPPRLLHALCGAARRAADVRVLLPGTTDLPIVQTIARGEYRAWLDAGIRIFEYQPVVMHSKFALVDDEWCTVGTFNAISASTWWANETNVIVQDGPFSRRAAEVFLDDLDKSLEVRRETFRRPPLRSAFEGSLNRLYRALEWCGSRFER